MYTNGFQSLPFNFFFLRQQTTPLPDVCHFVSVSSKKAGCMSFSNPSFKNDPFVVGHVVEERNRFSSIPYPMHPKTPFSSACRLKSSVSVLHRRIVKTYRQLLLQRVYNRIKRGITKSIRFLLPLLYGESNL